MYHVPLPALIGAGDNKGKPNLIEITSAKRKDGQVIKYGSASYVDAKGNTHVGIPAELFKYPQYGDEPAKNDKGEYLELTEEQAQKVVDEFIKDSGGVIRAAENIQDTTKKEALTKGKNSIRLREDGEPEKIVQSGLEVTQNFSWAQAERITNKTVRDEADKLADSIDDLMQTPEGRAEVARRMKAMVGKA